MIVEGGIGDAYGAGFEFVKRSVIEKNNNLLKYFPHPTHPEMVGKYTDDTQMSLAIAELIISGDKFSKINLANRFVDVFKRDVRGGYAGGFYQFLLDIKDGEDFLEKIRPTSSKNGAAMRAYPIGVFSNVHDVIDKASIQASLTHNTIDGIASSEAIALMAHYTLYGLGKLEHLSEFLSDSQGINWDPNWMGEVECDAYQSVDSVLTLLVHGPEKMTDILLDSVNFGGDVDTVASLALAIAANTDEVENDLPKWMYQKIESGKYGLKYLKKIDKLLLKEVDNEKLVK